MKKCPEQLQMTMTKDNAASAYSHYSLGLLAASRPPGRGWIRSGPTDPSGTDSDGGRSFTGLFWPYQCRY